MSLKFNSRRLKNELRMRFTSVDSYDSGYNLHAVWRPQKEEVEQWKKLLDIAESQGKMKFETKHSNYDPFIEVDIAGTKITVTSFSYEPADNFYEDDFSETVTLEEFKAIAMQIISELEALEN